MKTFLTVIKIRLNLINKTYIYNNNKKPSFLVQAKDIFIFISVWLMGYLHDLQAHWSTEVVINCAKKIKWSLS